MKWVDDLKKWTPSPLELYTGPTWPYHIMLGLGWGQIPGKPTVGKGSLQIFIQEHPTAPFIGPVPCTSLCFSNPNVSLWLLSAPNLLRYDTCPITPIWPLLPHLFSVWCVPMQKEYGGVFLGKFQTHLPWVLLPAVQLLFPICSLGSSQGLWSTPKSNTCQLFHS